MRKGVIKKWNYLYSFIVPKNAHFGENWRR